MAAKITYTQNGDYLIPDIELQVKEGIIGKYGILRKNYLRENRPRIFSLLTIQNKMEEHLMEVDMETRRKVENLEEELLKKNPAPEKMKDTMAWTRHMNMIHQQAEEMVMAETIYS